LVVFISENGDFSTNNVTLLLQEKFGDIIFELLENITEAYKSAKYYKEKLSSEGYRQDDIDRILFSSYQNLYGELESRSTQSSRFVESQYKNYFYLTRWENSPLQNIVIIDGIEKIIESDKVKAAVETKDGVYVMHFEKNASCLPFLHELGHIVFDALKTLGYEDRLNKSFMSNLEYDNIDEYFVSRFLGYLKQRIDDKDIFNDFRMDFSIRSEESINEILDEFFVDVQADERLRFVQTMLDSI
jgi:hypothetical protein